MSFKLVFIIVILIDIFFSIRAVKKDLPSFKEKLPYQRPTFWILSLTPSIIRNYYLINSCSGDESLQRILIYLICSSVLMLFANVKKSVKVKKLILTVALNFVYVSIVSPTLYAHIEDSSILNVPFIVLTVTFTFLVYLAVVDIAIKNILYGIFTNGKEYSTIITVIFYILTAYFATNVSIFRYYDNVMEILSPSSEVTNANIGSNGNVDKNINTYEYTPKEEALQNITTIESSLTPLDDDISVSLQCDYTDCTVGNGIVWLLDGTEYQNIEFLKYLEIICTGDDNYNPFRISKFIMNDYLGTEISPEKFSCSANFDDTNSLKVDYSTDGFQDVDTYVKTVYLDIMSNFCSKSIDLDEVSIGEEDTQKYVFTVYYNEVTQTYDIFCLYFNFDGETLTGISYDIVSISETPVPIYSTYADILPESQTETVKENYEVYSINDEYYITFKYYKKGDT